MLNFYREYIPKLARVAETNYRLTRKDQVWSWNEVRQTNFEQLKEFLVKQPVLLRYPD